jgi:hypothetical protein
MKNVCVFSVWMIQMSNKDEQSFQAFFNTSSLAVWNLWLSKLFQFFLLCQLTEFDNV